MTAKLIFLSEVSRTTPDGATDSLSLLPGVNVIVGEKSAGKTGWLNTISFLLGDTNTAEKTIKTKVAQKYTSGFLSLSIGGSVVTLARKWKGSNSSTAIQFDGRIVSQDDFSDEFLKALDIPVVVYPKGNPYVGKWSRLSWRILFRHMYRRETFWSGLADGTPAKEQHACVAQFLGVLEKMYPVELGELVEKNDELKILTGRKLQFDEVLRQSAEDIVPELVFKGVPTSVDIDLATARLRLELDEFRRRRESILLVLEQAREEGPDPQVVSELRDRLEGLSAQCESARSGLARTDERRTELMKYLTQVREELDRLRRARKATELLGPLKVRVCPYCDQQVKEAGVRPGECFVCHQELPSPSSKKKSASTDRLDFEIDQRIGEATELEGLVERLDGDRATLSKNLRRIESELAEVEASLRPALAASAAILPRDVAVLDSQAGQWEEKIAQLLRFRRVIEGQDRLSERVSELERVVDTLSEAATSKGDSIRYEELSEILTRGINEYLDRLKEGAPDRWRNDPIRFRFNKSTISIQVGNRPYGTLSNSDQALVLLGYHYALLRTTGSEGFNYPGLALIDFPLTFADQKSVAAQENFLIEPFVELAKNNPRIQLIVAGRSFAGLEGVNRLELVKIWEHREELEPEGEEIETEEIEFFFESEEVPEPEPEQVQEYERESN